MGFARQPRFGLVVGQCLGLGQKVAAHTWPSIAMERPCGRRFGEDGVGAHCAKENDGIGQAADNGFIGIARIDGELDATFAGPRDKHADQLRRQLRLLAIG